MLTLGSSPNLANSAADKDFSAILIMSFAFLGVSSTLPARNSAQQAVSCVEIIKKLETATI